MKTSEELADLFAALSKAQGEIENASKSAENPFFNSKYADLASVLGACRKPLSDNGLSVFQGIIHGDTASLKTRLCHSSGQWIEDDGVPLLLDKQNMQGEGSALTYARRYGLMAAVGIAPEDDDGNAAVKNKAPEAEKVTTKTMKGPIKPMTSLQKAWRTFSDEIDACTDLDQFAAFKECDESAALIEQLKVDTPHIWDMEPDGDGGMGIMQRLVAKENELLENDK